MNDNAPKTEIVTTESVPSGKTQTEIVTTVQLPTILQGAIVLGSLAVAIIAGMIALTGGPYDVTTAMLGFAATVFGLSRANIGDALASLRERIKGKSK